MLDGFNETDGVLVEHNLNLSVFLVGSIYALIELLLFLQVQLGHLVVIGHHFDRLLSSRQPA